MERELKALIKAANELLAVVGGMRAADVAVLPDARKLLESEIVAAMRDQAGRWLRPTEIAALCPSAPEGRAGTTRVGFALRGIMRRKAVDGLSIEMGMPVGTRTSHYRAVHAPEHP